MTSESFLLWTIPDHEIHNLDIIYGKQLRTIIQHAGDTKR